MYFLLQLCLSVGEGASVSVLAGASLLPAGAQLCLLLDFVVSGQDPPVILESVGVFFLVLEGRSWLEEILGSSLGNNSAGGEEACHVRSQRLNLGGEELRDVLGALLELVATKD